MFSVFQREPRMTHDVSPAGHDHVSAFEKIRRVSDAGSEYWSSRDLAGVLGYGQYRNFEPVIEKAKTACINSGQRVDDHFAEIRKMVSIGSKAERAVPDMYLSRYACYLIVQNADPAKPVVATGQTYFAVQTRRQELADKGVISEDDLRLGYREDLKGRNKKLAATAKQDGVVEPVDYAIFQNHGYQGLYGGLTMQDIHKRKSLKKSQHILDHMGSSELAANIFRAAQTEEKIRRERITGKTRANRAHREVGEEVRHTIKRLGGTMPEDQPTPTKSTKQLQAKRKTPAIGKAAKKDGKRTS
jgi:DNA-damage-inducible protein D